MQLSYLSCWGAAVKQQVPASRAKEEILTIFGATH